MKRAMSLIEIKRALQHDIEELHQATIDWGNKALYFGRHKQHHLMEECITNRDKAKEQLGLSLRILRSFNT